MASVRLVPTPVAAPQSFSDARKANALRIATSNFALDVSEQVKPSVAQVTTAVRYGAPPKVTFTVTSDQDRATLEKALKSTEGLARIGLKGTVDFSGTTPRYSDPALFRGGLDIQVVMAPVKGWAAPTTQRTGGPATAQGAGQESEATQNRLWELSHSVASLSRSQGVRGVHTYLDQGELVLFARDAPTAEALMKLLLGPKKPQESTASGTFEAVGDFNLRYSDDDRFKSGVAVKINLID